MEWMEHAAIQYAFLLVCCTQTFSFLLRAM